MTSSSRTADSLHLSAATPSSEALTGWGRATHSISGVLRPLHLKDLQQSLADGGVRSIVARGNGRSYGDTALNDGGYVASLAAMNSVESFDPASGAVVVEPGVTFGGLLDRFQQQGWIPPVTPGTQFATIGGAIANDVHGKNHDRDGSLGDHVLWLDLLTVDGSLRRVSPDSSPELYAATIGGIGLTGFIVRACVKLRRIAGEAMRVTERPVRNLEEYFDVLEAARGASHYSVGWIDGTATGRGMGRGILETAEHHEGTDLSVRGRRGYRVPACTPSWVMNRLSVRAFNELYFRRIRSKGRTRTVDLRRFFYPLDAISNWNLLYGPRGFLQFQCVVPDAAARSGISLLMKQISAAASASFLAVIKTLGGDGRGYLSFPMKGVTLAMDFPMRPGAPELLDRLHDIVIDHGGRVYLAKDACLRPHQFQRMYPRLDEMRTVLRYVDPGRRIRSDMAVRLQV